MPKTILLVDDNPDARAIFGAALQDGGYRVIMGVNGAEAVHLGRRYRPDLILTDIKMPVMDAWAALRYLRTDPTTAGRPIWAISAYIDEERADHQESDRFDRMVAKPLDPAVLVSAVDDYFGTARAAMPRPE